MKTFCCKLQKQLNKIHMYIVVCMCIYYYIVYTFINNQRTSISKLNFFHSAHSSSVNKCKQISWMCFIVIYLFYIFCFFSFSFFFNFSVCFLLYFVQRDIGDCAECRCRVWQLFHMCYLSVRVCVSESCVCVCECTNCVFMWNKQFFFCGLH